MMAFAKNWYILSEIGEARLKPSEPVCNNISIHKSRTDDNNLKNVRWQQKLLHVLSHLWSDTGVSLSCFIIYVFVRYILSCNFTAKPELL